MEAPLNLAEFKAQQDFFIAYVNYIQKQSLIAPLKTLPTMEEIQKIKPEVFEKQFLDFLKVLKLNPENYKKFIKRNLYPRWELERTRQLKVKTFNLLVEALRRHFMHQRDNRNLPITREWLGLGTEAEYRSAIQEEYMVWFKHIPAPRIMGWLRVTDKGAAVLEKMKSLGELRKIFSGFDFTGMDKIGNIKNL